KEPGRDALSKVASCRSPGIQQNGLSAGDTTVATGGPPGGLAILIEGRKNLLERFPMRELAFGDICFLGSSRGVAENRIAMWVSAGRFPVERIDSLQNSQRAGNFVRRLARTGLPAPPNFLWAWFPLFLIPRTACDSAAWE